MLAFILMCLEFSAVLSIMLHLIIYKPDEVQRNFFHVIESW